MAAFAFYDSPFGSIRIGYEDGCILSIRCAEPVQEVNATTELTDLAMAQLQEYFAGARSKFTFPIFLQGTPFQVAVWRALQQIPYGETRTYGQIAAAVGNPKASRAVGMANNRNPIWIVVPCHRVVGSNQNLTGYAGGLAMKQQLLTLEKNNRNRFA